MIQEQEGHREPVERPDAEREIHALHTAPLSGHHDAVTDIALCHSTQSLVLSSSANGHIKVWK